MRISIAATAACLSMAGPTLSNVASAAQSADSESTATTYLEEIIVTAQKRDERLQDVPSSVTALSSQRMLESHQTQLLDYAATVPGLQVQNAGAPGRSSLTMPPTPTKASSPIRSRDRSSGSAVPCYSRVPLV